MSDIEMIRDAAARAKGHITTTPLLSSDALDQIAGRRVLVKAECLQVTGSFKARGGWAAVSALDAGSRARGVLAMSSGNHAQGVARAAAAFGIPATIVMPADAPASKIDNTRALGAEVITYDRSATDRDALADRICDERNLTLIRPFDDAQVIAGQGTVGLEIASQARDAGASEADVLVCCGGGGLSSGIALALEADAPGLRVRPVEPVGFDDMTRSLAGGERVSNAATTGSVCDAILTPRPGALTFPILQRLAGPGIVVSDDEAVRAVALAFRHLRLIVEPGGAVALAAALFHGGGVPGDAVVVVATGGNVDAAQYANILQTA